MQTTSYHFQHPENGHPMVLKLNDDDQPEVIAGDVDDPHWAPVVEADALYLSQALLDRGVSDLHDAATFLYQHHHCRDIFS